MLGFRSAVGGDAVTGSTSVGGFLAFSRGSRGFVAINAGSKQHEATVVTTLPEGSYCDVVGGALVEGESADCTGQTLEVTGAGEVAVVVPADGRVAIHVGSRLNG